MDATPDPHARRRRRATEVATLLCRIGGLLGSSLSLAGLGPSGAHRPLGLIVINVVSLVLVLGACYFTFVNLARPYGPQYRLYGYVQVTSDTIAVCLAIFWLQFQDGHSAWAVLLLPIITGAQRLRLRGALVLWAVTTVALLAGALIDPPVAGLADVLNAFVVSLPAAILCGGQSHAYFRHVGHLQHARQMMEHKAGHDALTGLPNRTLLERYAASVDGRMLAVLLLDLNGFKQINDTLGHAVGDDLLKMVGRRIEQVLRDGDLPGRLGGDEFVVLLPDTDATSAQTVADRLRESIAQPVDVYGHTVQVGVSIGVASRLPGEGTDFKELTIAADAAMYRNKGHLRRVS